MMKKMAFVGCCVTVLLAFSGCSSDPEPPTVKITISGINKDKLPNDVQFFALSVFAEDATIGKLDDAAIAKIGPTEGKTILTGATSEGFTMLSNFGATFNLTFSCPDFVPGKYVLVLGASASTEKAPDKSGGKLYITGTDTQRGTVSISQSSVTIGWSDFANNSGNGWTLNNTDSEATLKFFNGN